MLETQYVLFLTEHLTKVALRDIWGEVTMCLRAYHVPLKLLHNSEKVCNMKQRSKAKLVEFSITLYGS